MALLAMRGWSWRLVGLLALAVTAACLTQGRAIALIVPAVFAIGLAGWRRWRPRGSVRPLGRGVTVLLWLAAVVEAVLAFGLYATRFSLGNLGGFWSYVWQFYLPSLPGMEAPVGPAWGADDVYLRRLFGTFVQFEVGFPRDLLDAIRLAIWAGLVLLVVGAWRHRAAVSRRRDVVLVLGLTVVLTIIGLHAAAFRALLVNPADPVFTGRYLLMLIPLYGIAVAGALWALPGRLRALTTGGVVAALFLLQLSAFGLVVERFYA
jgi:hypothetical protein